MRDNVISSLLGIPQPIAEKRRKEKSGDSDKDSSAEMPAGDESEPVNRSFGDTSDDVVLSDGADAGSNEDSGTLSARVSDLASKWNTGNKRDVVDDFVDMSNREAVELVFAIGKEGALELAQIADEIPIEGEDRLGDGMDDMGDPTEVEFEKEISFEPEMRQDDDDTESRTESRSVINRLLGINS